MHDYFLDCEVSYKYKVIALSGVNYAKGTTGPPSDRFSTYDDMIWLLELFIYFAYLILK